MKSTNCSNENKLTCPTCKLLLNKTFLGERCPRCNSAIMPKSCERCIKHCK